MTTAKILVVDDDSAFLGFVSQNLHARNYTVFTASNGLEALAIFHTHPLHLIILDIMMPNMDGLETCRRIRSESTVPILVLTALGEEADKVKALDLGADDYLTKPFGIEELLARVRSILRRIQWEESNREREILRFEDIELNCQDRTILCRGQELTLTQTEYELLLYLMRNRGRVLSHKTILKSVWGEGYGYEPEYLRVYIGRLRRKIEVNPEQPVYLKTEHGVGYRFG